MSIVILVEKMCMETKCSSTKRSLYKSMLAEMYYIYLFDSRVLIDCSFEASKWGFKCFKIVTISAVLPKNEISSRTVPFVMSFTFGRALVSIDMHVITRFWQNGPGYRVSMASWRGTNAWQMISSSWTRTSTGGRKWTILKIKELIVKKCDSILNFNVFTISIFTPPPLLVNY